ncbi:helix-turn-helix domain-containing protein [Acinetobacter sp. CFCC 10889]|uniref:helix-turn-helix domain-containing protein n=1 Tax=Acinetobacter sp. CFCC 10889 TaxID=1775557 RepID=UPI000DD0C76B|nr:helix-turn-helix transcriptional regulator [Acinetobacter sp. CFCC 10889]
MVVNNKITNLREQAGMTIYELSKRCGFISNGKVVSGALLNAEKGKNITIETAFLIYTELKNAGVCENFEDVFWLDDSSELKKAP